MKDTNTPWGLQIVFGASLGFLIIGDLVVIVYSGPDWSAAFMAAIAATVVGMAIGFLFGIPKTLQGNARKSDRTGGQKESEFETNTNLEQISDWLTKILVGAGLVQYRELKSVYHNVAEKLAQGIPSQPHAEVFADFMLIYFLTTGFLACYLLTRTYLPGLFSRAAAERFAAVESKVQEITNKVASIFDSDPHKGNFGGKPTVNGRTISAKVSPDQESAENFIVNLEVRSEDPKFPLTNPVMFYIHPTYSQSVIWINPENGVAKLRKEAWGAFTVGAEIAAEKIRLELDLSELPDAPAKFKSR